MGQEGNEWPPAIKTKRKRTPKAFLRFLDLEQSNSAVLNSLAISEFAALI
jgi:hypothetical protein